MVSVTQLVGNIHLFQEVNVTQLVVDFHLEVVDVILFVEIILLY